MGQEKRARPECLPKKLLHIREGLGLSQSEIARRLGLTGEFSRGKISEFENGRREPSLLVLLKYARVAGVPMEDLVDDKIDLPKKLPGIGRRKSGKGG
jgi:transcriptional regulator with XRE-family HTH domain